MYQREFSLNMLNGLSHASIQKVQNQNAVNLTIFVWWLVTSFCCLLSAGSSRFYDAKPFDSERFLVPDHSSPAGYKVPCLPDYEIDTALSRIGGLWFLSMGCQLTLSLLMIALVGSGMLLLTYSSWDDQLADQVQASLGMSNADV